MMLLFIATLIRRKRGYTHEIFIIVVTVILDLKTFWYWSFYEWIQSYKMPEINSQKDLTLILYTICLQNKTGIGHFYRIASITSLVSQDMSRIACIKENSTIISKKQLYMSWSRGKVLIFVWTIIFHELSGI